MADEYAYLVDGSAGLRVVDVSDPEHPVKVGFYDSPGFARGLTVAGEYVYVADESAGLRVVDVSDWQNPVEVGFYDPPGLLATSVAAAGEHVYVDIPGRGCE